MTRRLRSLVAATALVLSFPGFVGVVGAQISDREIITRVSESIARYPRYTIFDSIEIGVENRTLTIGGRVTTPKKKEEIEERLRKIEGIRTIVNDIGVLPVSQADDDLRYRVANAIYSHPMFWIYAQMPVPPIHIIVERGRITLTGAADSEVQKSLAATLAQVPGVFTVTNRIRVDRH